MKRTTLRRAAVLGAVVALLLATAARPVAAAVTHVRIEGTGSSWSAIAMAQWIADVQQQGMQVVFTPAGSASGRKDFAYQTNDFAISDIPFQGRDPLTGEDDTPRDRPYSYLPMVAGGTAFPYHLEVGGKQVRNLRLSGDTLAKIFTNRITRWDDEQIAADNNHKLKLPALTIKPVLHAEGSGSTAQFTMYLAKQFPQYWGEFNKGKNVETEYFPRSGNAVPQAGSDSVMNFITSKVGNGSIGYDEYSFAQNIGWPVAKIGNTAGYFTEPTEYNVAVSLTKAQIDSDPKSPTYLIQSLDQVYVNPDPRTYPLSSYSYMVLPTGTAPKEKRLTTEKRQTLADFVNFSICAGQKSIGAKGYSPLPLNLVQNGFEQVRKLAAADSKVTIDNLDAKNCNNPTFVPGDLTRNHLAEIAPQPKACDKLGADPCAGTTGGGGGSTSGGPSGTGGGGGTSGSGGGSGTGAGGAGGTGGPGGTGGTAGSGGAASAGDAGSSGPQIDPDTGEVVGNTGAGGANTDANAAAVPTDLAAFRANRYASVLGPVAVGLLLIVLFAPALFARVVSGRKEGQ